MRASGSGITQFTHYEYLESCDRLDTCCCLAMSKGVTMYISIIKPLVIHTTALFVILYSLGLTRAVLSPNLLDNIQRKFEFQNSFKPPTLINAKGEIPFWKRAGGRTVDMKNSIINAVTICRCLGNRGTGAYLPLHAGQVRVPVEQGSVRGEALDDGRHFQDIGKKHLRS